MSTAYAGVRPERREGVVETFWRVASSLALTPWLAAAAAAAYTLGLFLGPAEAPLAEMAAQWGDAWWWPAYGPLELYAIPQSWWFSLLLVALVLNVAASAVEHLPRALDAALRPDRRLTDFVALGIRRVRRFTVSGEPAARVERLSAIWRDGGFEPVVEKEGATAWMFAERGRLSGLGPWVARFALLVLAAGVLVGRFFGFEGRLDAGEGTAADAMFRRAPTGEQYRAPLPFTAKVNALTLLPPEGGARERLRSDVSLLRDGKEYRRQNVEDGHPLRDSGLALSQAGHREDPGGARAELAFTDKQTGKVEPLHLGRGETWTAPDGVRFAVVGYSPNYVDLGPAAQVTRVENGKSTTFWVFQNAPDFDRENRPDRWGLSFKGLSSSFVTTLRISHDPQLPWLLGGVVLFVLGLLLRLASPHRRLWARVEERNVVLAASDTRGPEKLEKVLDSMGAALGS
jgi:cytochrome c biogenesis protein